MSRPSRTCLPGRFGKGTSLTELLVATALFTTLSAGGLASLSRALDARRETGHLQELHERVQYAFATLEPEIQLAGYFGHSRPGASLPESAIPEPARRCGSAVVAHLEVPIEVLPSWNLPCAPNGGGALAGSNVLVIRRASARLAATPEAGRAQWLARPGDLLPGHLYWQGDAPWPGDPATELRDLVLRIYYIATESDGDASTPALRVKSLSSIAGVPAFIDTEVMPGVEDLQVELLPTATRPQGARVQLRVRVSHAGLPGAAPALEASRHLALRNPPG